MKNPIARKKPVAPKQVLAMQTLCQTPHRLSSGAIAA
jgi:hypothetical protein